MTQEARIEAAARGIMRRSFAFDALGQKAWDDPELRGQWLTTAAAAIEGLNAAADAVTTLPDPVASAGSVQKMDDPYKPKVTLPDEELDAIEAWAAEMLRLYKRGDVTAEMMCSFYVSLPAHSIRSQMLALVAEVRRLRAGSVSEYQQIGLESADGKLWRNDQLELMLRAGYSRGRPVWVRKEDAT